MFPFIFDWDWSVDRIVFMGVFYVLLAIIAVGLAEIFRRTLRNLDNPDQAHQESGEHH